jgi:uncharacterized cupredoxin-like copper-binding protein
LRVGAAGLAVALLVGGAVVGACGHGEDRPGIVTAPAMHTSVDVAAREFAFDGTPASVPAGDVDFTIRNVGALTHQLIVVGADGEPAVEVSEIRPGATGPLSVRLRPGRWTIVCMLKQGARTHADLGMRADLTVT